MSQLPAKLDLPPSLYLLLKDPQRQCPHRPKARHANPGGRLAGSSWATHLPAAVREKAGKCAANGNKLVRFVLSHNNVGNLRRSMGR